MKQKFETTHHDARPILAIRTATTMDKIGEVMGSLFGEVYGCIQQSGQEPAGMPFSIYHSMDGDAIDLECGMPVAAPTEGMGRADGGYGPRHGGRAARRNRGDGHARGAVRRPPADLGRPDGVDRVAGSPTRGCALGGLRHRPRRRARPVEVAY